VFTYAKYGAAGQRLDQHVEFDQATRYEWSHDAGAVVTTCGCRKRCRASLRLIAGSVLGSSAIPVWTRGTKEFFRRGYPFSLRKAARSVPWQAGRDPSRVRF
jgi:hypothetical protein